LVKSKLRELIGFAEIADILAVAGTDNNNNHERPSDDDEEYDDDDDDDDDNDCIESEDEVIIVAKPARAVAESNKTGSRSKNFRGAERPHAAVERRYRSVINDKIQQLYDTIPESGVFVPLIERPLAASEPELPKKERPSKFTELERAVQYIDHLRKTFQQYEAEDEALRHCARKILMDLETGDVQAVEQTGDRLAS